MKVLIATETWHPVYSLARDSGVEVDIPEDLFRDVERVEREFNVLQVKLMQLVAVAARSTATDALAAPSGEFGDHIRVSRRFSAGGFNPAIPGDFVGLVPHDKNGSATGPHIHLDTQVPSCAARVKTWLMRRRFEDDETSLPFWSRRDQRRS